MSAHLLTKNTDPVSSKTPYVVIHEEDWEKVLDALDYLKGWSPHTEGGAYRENAARLVVAKATRVNGTRATVWEER